MMTVATYDFIVIGSGIVGLSVATELLKRQPNSSIAIVEKESAPGVHASGRNSGVLHSGIYYTNDTMKAKVCAKGGRRMIEFAVEENIDFSQDGKVIIATSEEQLPIVDKLLNNAANNKIPAERIDNKQLMELEPYASPDSLAAIYCKTTAVIDSKAVVGRLHEKLIKQGVAFLLNTKFIKWVKKGEIMTSKGRIQYGFLYNCAGAYADKVAKHFGLAGDYELIPFKGIYWKLSKDASYKIRANIYPVPDISMPFLGVHLTKVISGDVYVGPTAIPAFGRENYNILSDIRVSEALPITVKLLEMYLKNKNNFRKMTYLEMSKYWKPNFLAAAKKLMPSLEAKDLVPTSKVGIRPQLININTGELEMDYIFESTIDSLHVLNSISPAFTSSFAFAELIVDKSKNI